jgi:predicted permease
MTFAGNDFDTLSRMMAAGDSVQTASVEDEPWKYLGVLNVCIQTLLTIGLGSLVHYCRMVEARDFIPQATKFVFYIALPCHILKGIGIGVDFYDDSLLWNYICAFLILRAIALVVCVAWVVLIHLHQPERDAGSIGQIAVQWLALTWISTVILGVPIAGAVFGDPRLGLQYGILAAISSFIFQLPLQMFFLECHALEQESTASRSTLKADDAALKDYVEDEQDKEACDTTKKDVEDGMDDAAFEEIQVDGSDVIIKGNNRDGETTSAFHQDGVFASNNDPQERAPTHPTEGDKAESDIVPKAVVPLSMWLVFFKRGDIWKKILVQLLRNPIIWAIIFGFILSLSTVGPRYLDPMSVDYVPGLGWFDLTLSWLGACVSPTALICMGVWMQAKWKDTLFGCGSLLPMTLYMTSKLVLVPLVMVGLAKAVKLDDEAGRAAVLIAALPISLASFSLANRYKIGETVLAENVAWGTALILPTILIWNLVMDELGLFPLA